jgi:putative membrane protein
MKLGIKGTVLSLVGLAMLTGSVTAFAADSRTGEQRGQLSESDYKFVKDAAKGGQAEVQLGELAKQKGVNEAVKSFGEQMVTDHTKANNELQQIASQKGATLPSTVGYKENADIAHLQKATGKDFDKAYADHMVKDHKTDVKEFQDASKNLQDPDLRAFAAKTLPTLEQHYSAAKQMQAAVKNEK